MEQDGTLIPENREHTAVDITFVDPPFVEDCSEGDTDDLEDESEPGDTVWQKYPWLQQSYSRRSLWLGPGPGQAALGLAWLCHDQIMASVVLPIHPLDRAKVARPRT